MGSLGTENELMFEKNLDYWAKKELNLTRKKLQIRDSLADMETAAGVALLGDGEESGDITPNGDSLANLERAHAELRALTVAIAGCRNRRLAAIEAKRAVTVSALREEVADKESELSALDSKTRGLLEEISELQGIQYPPRHSQPKPSVWPVGNSAQRTTP